MSDKHDSAVRTILGLGEEKMGEVVNQLLANEAFVGAVQRAITGSIGAKRTVDKGVSAVLGMVNIPTLDDVDKIKDRLNELEQAMTEITERLTKLNESLPHS